MTPTLRKCVTLACIVVMPGSAAHAQFGTLNVPKRVVADTTRTTATPATDTTLVQSCETAYRAAAQRNRALVSYGCWGLFLGGKSPARLKEYFGSLAIGNSTAISLGGDEANLYTELLSDAVYMASRIGYARMGLGTLEVAPDI